MVLPDGKTTNRIIARAMEEGKVKVRLGVSVGVGACVCVCVCMAGGGCLVAQGKWAGGAGG